MNGFEDVSRDHFPLRSPELDGMETGSALPAAANSAVAAAPQPTPTPIPIAQVSQPPVSKRDIVKLQTRMEELAHRLASFDSERWKNFVIKQDILDSFDDLEEKKDILEDKIAALQRMLDSKTAPAAPPMPQPKQETSHVASHSSTYAATVLSVKPNQWQTKTNYCEQIDDRKRKMQSSPNHGPNADLQRSPDSMRNRPSPF
jgi:hypothetical protein